MCDLANLSGVIRDTLSRGSFYTQTGTLHLTLHHFTPQKGYSLHHVNRTLLWLRINVFVSHSAASLFLSTKSVNLPLLHLKIYFTGFDALMSFAGFVLKEAFWSSACLPNTYAWGKWSGRSRGCVAWLRFGPDEDGRCAIGLWNRLCIVFLGSMSWCWINTFLLQDQNLDRFLYIYIYTYKYESWAFKHFIFKCLSICWKNKRRNAICDNSKPFLQPVHKHALTFSILD